jgi:phage-related protein
MKTVRFGTYEICIKESGGEYRVFYMAKFGDTIYVLHAFQEKSRKIPVRHLNVGQHRYEIAKEHAEK